MKQHRRYRVIGDVFPRPNSYEKTAAERLADFLHADVEFIQSRHSAKNADLLIAGQRWEIKTPTGSSPNTIRHQFQRASRQANFLVFDARRIKMQNIDCLKRVRHEFKNSRNIERVIYISKDGNVIEL